MLLVIVRKGAAHLIALYIYIRVANLLLLYYSRSAALLRKQAAPAIALYILIHGRVAILLLVLIYNRLLITAP